jgi:DNA primase small subunit
MTSEMPHSLTPESTPAEESSATISQADVVKSEPETQDVAMDGVPAPAAVEKPKVNLEELFDDEDLDDEFSSSVPVPPSQEDLSQDAPMYAPTC